MECECARVEEILLAKTRKMRRSAKFMDESVVFVRLAITIIYQL
jgi:hypothetical protein